MKPFKLIIALSLVTLTALAFIFDLQTYLTLDYFKEQQQYFSIQQQEHPLLIAGLFFALYIAVTTLSLPGAVILTLAAGALFDLWLGLLIVSFASSLGATFAFLVSRYLFRDTVQAKFSHQLTTLNAGIQKDGALYLFTLRLVPAFPFFMINLLMGLTPIKTWTFYWMSQLGMFAGTIVFVNAGTQIAQIDSLSGILSPTLILSFILLGLFPLITKTLIAYFQTYQQQARYLKPKHFDYNLLVIGAGAGGLVSAYIAAAVKAKVGLIEKHKMGGDCLNTGCVPSKALIRAAHSVHEISRASQFGVSTTPPSVDFERVFEGVQQVIQNIEPHDSIERYSGLGVECITGEAKLVSPYEVDVNGQRLTAKNIVIATGARPFIPDIKDLHTVEYFTSDTLWTLRRNPERLIVLGGGPIGCELAQAFARLGSCVTQIERGTRILSREDEEASKWVEQQFINDGVTLLTQYQAESIVHKDGEKWLSCRNVETQDEKLIAFDTLLIAVGRTPNTQGFGLEDLGIELDQRGAILVDQHLRASIPNIFAVGDVIGHYQFTHTASHQAWYAAVNALFGSFKQFKVDYRVIPWATFTDPEVARVGLNEQEADAQNIAYEVVKFELCELDRAIADRSTAGFVKVLTVPNKDTILGVTIVGQRAGDLIAEYVQAMKYRIGLNKVLSTIHIYPTMTEANKYAAGEWKRAHIPHKTMSFLAKFHRWQRKG